MNKFKELPKGFYTVEEIVDSLGGLGVDVNRVNNLYKYFHIKRYKKQGKDRPLWCYNIDTVRRLHELHIKGLTAKQVKKFIKDNPGR